MGLFAAAMTSIADAVDAVLAPLAAEPAKRRDSMDGPLEDDQGRSTAGSVLSLLLLYASALWAALGHLSLAARWLANLRTEYGREVVKWFAARSPAPLLAIVVCGYLCRAHLQTALVAWIRDHRGFAVDFAVDRWTGDALGVEVVASDVACRDASRPETCLEARACDVALGVEREPRTKRLVVALRVVFRGAGIETSTRLQCARTRAHWLISTQVVRGAALRYVGYDGSDGDSSVRRALARLARSGRPPPWLLRVPYALLRAGNRVVATVAFEDGVAFDCCRARTRQDPARQVFACVSPRLPRVVDATTARGLHVLHALLLREIREGAPAKTGGGVRGVVLAELLGNVDAELARCYETVAALDAKLSPRSRSLAELGPDDGAASSDEDLATPVKAPAPAKAKTPRAVRLWNSLLGGFVGRPAPRASPRGPAPIRLGPPSTPAGARG